MRNTHNANPSTAAYTFVDSVTTVFCPQAVAGQPDWPCNGEVNLTNHTVTFAAAMGANGLFNNIVGGETAIDSPALENLFQVLYAAVRLDIGYVLSNNVLTNSAAFDAAININTGTDNPTLLRDRLDPAKAQITYPLTSRGLAILDLSYECTYKYRKSAAEILISVLVATASLFASGWAFMMLAAGYFAGKEPQCRSL